MEQIFRKNGGGVMSGKTRTAAFLHEQLTQLYHDGGVNVFPMSLLKKLSPAGTSDEHLRVIVARHVAAGKLVRLARGVYTFRWAKPKEEEIMHVIDPAAYISMESRLSSASVLQQGIAVLTCVTPKRERSFDAPEINSNAPARIRFHHLDEKYFTFGIQDGYQMEPEKAILDMIHVRLFSRKSPMPGGNWNVERLYVKKAVEYSRQYPPAVRNVLRNFLKAERTRKRARAMKYRNR